MDDLATAVPRYVHEALGMPPPPIQPLARANELPYFLRELFQLGEIELLGHPLVLAMEHAARRRSLGKIGTWMDQITALTKLPTVYVTDALTSYERRRLIQQNVPFIVPGNQMYLPPLGLDLREHFRQRRAADETAPLSPSAQAVLLTALLHRPWQSEWQPSTVAAGLGYTPMTLSRAAKELTGSGLATAYTVARSRWLRMERSPRQVWERAKPVLRSPVVRTVWVRSEKSADGSPWPHAGLSALACHSMLAEPTWPVYAVTSAQLKTALRAGARELPEPDTGAQEWQVWSYSPTLLSPDAKTIDPLSLMLSLQDDPDERVQLALEELKDLLPW